MAPFRVRHPRRSTRWLAALPVAALALAPAMSAATAPETKASHAVSVTAKLHIKPQGGAFVGSGAASGLPFGAGRARLRSTIKSRSPLRTASTLTIVTTKGNAIFKGTGRYVGSTFKSTMKVFSGAGEYHAIAGTDLAVTVSSRNGVDTLRMKGTVRYGPSAVPAEPVDPAAP